MPTRPPIHRTGKTHDEIRGNAHARGYDARWRRLRDWFIQQNPLCVICERLGKTMQAECVDHIKAHKGNEELRLDPENLQSLCWSCHSKKTVKHDGGFGNATAPQ
jgi:5-methylcytosine-specific restriction protein A